VSGAVSKMEESLRQSTSVFVSTYFSAHKFDQLIYLLLKSEDLLVFGITGLAAVVIMEVDVSRTTYDRVQIILQEGSEEQIESLRRDPQDDGGANPERRPPLIKLLELSADGILSREGGYIVVRGPGSQDSYTNTQV